MFEHRNLQRVGLWLFLIMLVVYVFFFQIPGSFGIPSIVVSALGLLGAILYFNSSLKLQRRE